MPHFTITNPVSGGSHDISYTTLGDSHSANKIIFVMGLLTDGAAWKYQADHFAEKGYHVVFYDNRGIGHSTYPSNERCTTKRMAYDAVALVDHLQWSTFHLVGVSMGYIIQKVIDMVISQSVTNIHRQCCLYITVV